MKESNISMNKKELDRLTNKLANNFMKISLQKSNEECSDFVCKLSFIYKEVINKSEGIKTTLIDFKQFEGMNEYLWQTISMSGIKCLLIFLNTENEDDFTFYKLI